MYSRVIAVLLLAAAGISPALAQELCIECAGPDVTYRCSVKDSERVAHIRGSGKALEFVCISELARAGGHKSCKVGTGYSGPCIGQPRTIDLSKSGDDVITVTGRPAPAPGDQAAGQPPPEGDAAAQQKKGPPQTLVELARESGADESMKKAGQAVGGALKKSWSCLSSLFTDC